MRRAINSVLEQTFQDFEFIIINDGSTDCTAEILDEYANCRGVRVRGTKKQGVTKALALALKCAEGEYVTFISHDDWWRPYKLECEVRTLDNCSQKIGVVYSNFYQYFVDARRVKPVILSSRAQDDILQRCGLNISSAMVRRAALLQLRKRDGYILDQNLKDCIDWDLWIRLSTICHFKHIPQLLTNYSIHRKQMSRSFSHGVIQWKMHMRYNGFQLLVFLNCVFRAPLRHLLGRPYKWESQIED